MLHMVLVAMALSSDSFAAGFLTRVVGIRANNVWMALLFAFCDGAATYLGLVAFGARAPEPRTGWPLTFLAAFCLVCTVLVAQRGRGRASILSTRSIYLLPLLLSIDNLTVAPDLAQAASTQAMYSLMAATASGLLFCVGSFGGELARQQTHRLRAARSTNDLIADVLQP